MCGKALLLRRPLLLPPSRPVLRSGVVAPEAVFSRAGTAWSVNADGLWSAKAANVLRLDPTGAAIIEGSRQCRVRWNRDLTNAAWTRTGLTAARAAGIDGVAGSGSQLTATAAGGTCLQANNAGSTTVLLSAFARRVAGTGPVEMTWDGGATWTPIVLGPGYGRALIAPAVVGNPSVGFRLGTAGDAIAVDLVQLEPSTSGVHSSPIETTTASVTRAADILSWPLPAAMADQGTILLQVRCPPVLPAGSSGLMCLDDGTMSNRIGAAHNGQIILATAGGTGLASPGTGVTPTPGAVLRIVLTYHRPSAYVGLAAQGRTTTTQGAALPPFAALLLGHLNRNGTAPFGAAILRVEAYPVVLTNTQLAALTA